MKCAILGNGPSHKLYNSSSEYALVIGCNIPWSKVDFTVIMDENIIKEWQKVRDLINVPVYFSIRAWREAHKYKFRDYLKEHSLYLGLYEPEVDSTGHMAALIAINQGYKFIDLFGFDSYYYDNVESLTRQYVEDQPTNNSKRWRDSWNKIIDSNPNVVFNFIKE